MVESDSFMSSVVFTFGLRYLQHECTSGQRFVCCILKIYTTHLLILSVVIRGTLLWDYFLVYSKSLTQNTLTLLKRVKLFTKIGAYIDRTLGGTRWAFWNRWNASENSHDRKNSNSDGKSWLNSELEHNINMPTTGEEAMKRLLACKGKDPYRLIISTLKNH